MFILDSQTINFSQLSKKDHNTQDKTQTLKKYLIRTMQETLMAILINNKILNLFTQNTNTALKHFSR